MYFLSAISPMLYLEKLGVIMTSYDFQKAVRMILRNVQTDFSSSNFTIGEVLK